MLDNLVDVQERNRRKRKTADRRKTLNQWLMECEDYEDIEVEVFEPLKSKRVKFAAQDSDYREYVSRSIKRDHQRNPLRAQKWAVDE